ncbi:MAG: hypothetical protein II126_02920 [Erysipelotrichaceae bacterium]|nr:hypothetical protein [Erysipelotrichaceae bacterium]
MFKVFLRSMEASEKMADGQATKIIVPSDLQNVSKTAEVFKAIFKDK